MRVKLIITILLFAIGCVSQQTIPDEPRKQTVPVEPPKSSNDIPKAYSTGVVGQTINGELVVQQILPDSPADKAGIRRRDVILSVDGKHVQTVDQLNELVGNKNKGEKAHITFRRMHDIITVYVDPSVNATSPNAK
jgi:S1-C subfamily serine protease